MWRIPHATRFVRSSFVESTAIGAGTRIPEGAMRFLQFLESELRSLLRVRTWVSSRDILKRVGHLFHELVALGVVLGTFAGTGRSLLGAGLGLLLEAGGGDRFFGSHGHYSLFYVVRNEASGEAAGGPLSAVYRI